MQSLFCSFHLNYSTVDYFHFIFSGFEKFQCNCSSAAIAEGRKNHYEPLTMGMGVMTMKVPTNVGGIAAALVSHICVYVSSSKSSN